jgi:hypothetical protein
MDSSNYRKRVLHKLAIELGLPKLTFQVIRRTIATLAQNKGTVKDVQGIMRHSRVATTTDVYMQELPEGVRATVDSIHHELMGTGLRATARPSRALAGSRPAQKLFLRRARNGRNSSFQRKKQRLARGQSVVWFWDLRQTCDKVAEGRCF